MSDWCFVHAADLHLDTPFSGVESQAPDMAALLRDASLDAFDALVELAIDRRAAFLVIAGDVYDGAERGLRAQLRFRDGLERLAWAGIAAFVVHGNHDPVGEGWSAIESWPENVTVFGVEGVEVVPVARDGVPVAAVHGISYATRAVHENLARRFARTGEPGVHIGVLHCTVGDQSEHAPYAPCSLDDLRAGGMDYWALGHVHRRQVLQAGTPGGEPWVVYSGNTQGRSPKPSERGAKGALVVPVTDGAVGTPEFVAVDRVRFDEVEVAVDGFTDIGAVVDALHEAGTEASRRADNRGLVLRGRVTGRAPLHAELARPATAPGVLSALRDRHRTDPATWWDRVQVATRPPIDHEALRERPDVSGDVARLVDALREDPGRLADVAAAADVIVDATGAPVGPDQLAALLTEAETLALDVLSEPWE